MATRTGVLSDDYGQLNCESYKPLPIGYANANYQGNRGNPYLDGIKTPKYQVSAARPVSADVMAVNRAQLMGGVNKAGDARQMLDFYIKEAKEFKPPPVKTRSLEESVAELHDFLFGGKADVDAITAGLGSGYQSKEEFINDYYGLTSGPVPRFYNGNRGDKILKQTISVDSEVQTNPSTAPYLEKFFRSPRPQKEKINVELLRKLKRQGVDVLQYQLGQQPKITDLDENIKRLLQIVDARGVTIDLDKVFQMPTQALLSGAPPVVAQGSSSSDVGGTSTQASVAPTQQGIALPQTTTTTAEVEKK